MVNTPDYRGDFRSAGGAEGGLRVGGVVGSQLGLHASVNSAWSSAPWDADAIATPRTTAGLTLATDTAFVLGTTAPENEELTDRHCSACFYFHVFCSFFGGGLRGGGYFEVCRGRVARDGEIRGYRGERAWGCQASSVTAPRGQ